MPGDVESRKPRSVCPVFVAVDETDQRHIHIALSTHDCEQTDAAGIINGTAAVAPYRPIKGNQPVRPIRTLLRFTVDGMPVGTRAPCAKLYM